MIWWNSQDKPTLICYRDSNTFSQTETSLHSPELSVRHEAERSVFTRVQSTLDNTVITVNMLNIRKLTN